MRILIPLSVAAGAVFARHLEAGDFVSGLIFLLLILAPLVLVMAKPHRAGGSNLYERD